MSSASCDFDFADHVPDKLSSERGVTTSDDTLRVFVGH